MNLIFIRYNYNNENVSFLKSADSPYRIGYCFIGWSKSPATTEGYGSSLLRAKLITAPVSAIYKTSYHGLLLI